MSDGVLACLALLALQGAADWDSAWNELERLKTLQRGDPAAPALVRELEALAGGHEDDPRATLLRAELERWAGRDPGLLAERLARAQADGFSGREAWLLAEVLPAVPARAQAVVRALDQTPELSRDAVLFAWNVSVEEARAMRVEQGALPIQERLHTRYGAAWSAGDLSHTLSLIGRTQEADALLVDAIAKEEAAGRPTGDLWSQRGIQAYGSGDEGRGRDYFGRALALGSKDAALVLGREDLAAGRLEGARRGLRPSILSGDDTGWALRGWGMALLPGAHARATRPTLGPGVPKDKQ